MKRLTSWLTSAFVTLMLILGLTVVHSAPAQANATLVAKYSGSAQKITNKIRTKRDRVRLKGNKCLKRHAKSHARAMARAQDIWHQDMGALLRSCNLRMVGENVAAGFPTGRAVVRRGWMKSAGHRRNLLHRHYRLGVVAAVQDDDGRWYAVQLLGRR